ncbi:hypothetical protein F0562_003868 [Nyssa sinensis]|uniref:Cation-transporting P-type ATPase N-terminal domain-containing protein n=1 Tax=Nyssa sinensis TaxID=561372 RepID=A0A5J5BWN5_9ASTE|nr:hypothetical protein F0562_003868 [Nyssa sinensis]
MDMDKTTALEAISKGTVDLENVPIQEVFEKLKCTRDGLSSAEVQKLLDVFGYNKLEEKKESKLLKFLGFMWNPLSWVMEAAALMAITLAHGGGKGTDYHDFIGILVLLIINSTISFIEENNAGNAAAALMARIKLGDIIPADARLLEGDPLKIDQSALTGESLPVTKSPGDGVLTSIGNFCICSIVIGMVIEIIVIFGLQRRHYREGIDNLLVLLIGGIPIAMPTVLSVTMAMGSHQLISAGTLTLNKLTVDKNMIEVVLLVFAKGVEKDMVVLMAARASRLENQDAIDCAIVSMLADPKEILNLAYNKSEIGKRVHSIIDKFAERGLRSLAIARQEVPAGTKDSPGGPWEFVGLLPLFDPPRHDSAKTIRRALHLGVSVKMITGDQLAIAKETGRRLGMGTNMYPSSSLLGEQRDAAVAALPIEELIEKADGFAGVFPEHKYEIVKRLQDRNHICGMTGDGVNNAPALKKADIGIAVADSTDAARSASDIVLTEPGLSMIISAERDHQCCFNKPCHLSKNEELHGTIMTISRDRVKPSPLPDSWKLSEIFATGIVIGSYLALMTVLFFYATYETSFFANHFHVKDFNKKFYNLMDDSLSKELNAQLSSAVYLQVSTISQALIFVTRSRGWSYREKPGRLLVAAYTIAQLFATLLSAVTSSSFAGIGKIGWLSGRDLEFVFWVSVADSESTAVANLTTRQSLVFLRKRSDNESDERAKSDDAAAVPCFGFKLTRTHFREGKSAGTEEGALLVLIDLTGQIGA